MRRQQLTVEAQLPQTGRDGVGDEHRLALKILGAGAPAALAQPIGQQDHPVFEFAVCRRRGLFRAVGRDALGGVVILFEDTDDDVFADRLAAVFGERELLIETGHARGADADLGGISLQLASQLARIGRLR